MPNAYIIAGCPGAGKTTTSYALLPQLHCPEFVNADNIAAGISPFHPENAAPEAEAIMLQRMMTLLHNGVDFAFETTLATINYAALIKKARQLGYTVNLLFLWLNSPDFAMRRVQQSKQNIPDDIVERRFYRGLHNLLHVYIPLCDKWVAVSNAVENPEPIASGLMGLNGQVINEHMWEQLLQQSEYHGYQ
ncbi:zeta toxin family protein [Deminuibacter soli]|uniref:Zeta toxin n=1 Tax=Deminuibacter soli TaxID=2291815 RepID=A0A3E1NQB0_9BACT|nr:zeta toxin family protein [Deminuibacter soli]RFM30139.1 zeta toxin [Deminuibacter soli]